MGVGDQRHVPAALPPEKTRYPLYRRLDGQQGRSGRLRKISSPPGFDPRTKNNIPEGHMETRLQFRGGTILKKNGATSRNFRFSHQFEDLGILECEAVCCGGYVPTFRTQNIWILSGCRTLKVTTRH